MNVKEIRRKNLRALARSVGGVTQLADRLNRSQSQISHLIGTNPVKNVGDKLAFEIERVFNKSTGWLDHEHMNLSQEATLYELETHRRKHHQLPLLSVSEASLWVDAVNKTVATAVPFIVTNVPVSEHAFAVRVEGDSMEAPNGVSFPNGSVIVVDPEVSVTNNAFVLAKQSISTQLVFKQYIVDGHRCYLKPLNPRYPLVEVSLQTKICGVVRLMLLEFK